MPVILVCTEISGTWTWTERELFSGGSPQSVLSTVSISSCLSWDCTNPSSVCSRAMLCVLSIFCYPYTAPRCAFHMVTLFAGVHRNNTDGAAYSTPPKMCLGQTLNKHWFPLATAALRWTNMSWAEVQKWSCSFPCINEHAVWLHRRAFVLCLVCNTGLVNLPAGLSRLLRKVGLLNIRVSQIAGIFLQ